MLSKPLIKPDMEARRDLGFKDDDFLILFVGQFKNDRKGLSFLLRSLKLVRQKIPKVRLIVCGKGNIPHISSVSFSHRCR